MERDGKEDGIDEGNKEDKKRENNCRKWLGKIDKGREGGKGK